MPDVSVIAAPLHALLKKNVPYEWKEEVHTKALDALKTAVCTPGIGLSNPDPEKAFHLHVDWSCNGISGILTQKDDKGNDVLIACVSRSLNEHEKRYPAWKGELLAVTYAVRSYRSYLYGRHFMLYTDHRPLLWLLSASHLNSQFIRFVLILQEFDYSIVHQEGVNQPADAPSRYPLPMTMDLSGARIDSGPVLAQTLPRVITEHGVEIVLTATTKQVHLSSPCEHKLASQLVALVMMTCELQTGCVDSTLDFFPEHVSMSSTSSEPPMQSSHDEELVKKATQIIK